MFLPKVTTQEGEEEVICPNWFGRDQLTTARAKACSELRINSDTPTGKLEAIVPTAEDRHTTVILLVAYIYQYRKWDTLRCCEYSCFCIVPNS